MATLSLHGLATEKPSTSERDYSSVRLIARVFTVAAAGVPLAYAYQRMYFTHLRLPIENKLALALYFLFIRNRLHTNINAVKTENIHQKHSLVTIRNNIFVTFLGILISCMSDVAFYYLRLDRYSISVGRFSSRVGVYRMSLLVA